MSEYYQRPAASVLAELNSSAAGLHADEAARRLKQHGPNALPHSAGPGVLQIFLRQFANLMVVILLIAAVVSYFLGDIKDVVIILIIAILNAVLGTYQEYRAEQALAALSAMQVPRVRVRRDGAVHEVSAEDLVPGDIVLLGEGDRVPADGRLIEAANMQIEEAALTGESVPVSKSAQPIPGSDPVPLGSRSNMAYMGTSINFGRAEMVVTATGLKTELGKIATLLMGVAETETPLQKRINRLGQILVLGAVVVVIAVFILGVARGIALNDMLITAIGLAVAAVPESLPAVITVALSLGAARMVQRHALIRRLPAVETLGSVTIICSDKTGTLTKNEMTTTQLALPGYDDVFVSGIGYVAEGEFRAPDGGLLDPINNPTVGRFLKAMALSTDAYLEPAGQGNGFQVVGDTTEGALLVAAQKVGWTRQQLEQDMPRVAELPFSSERKAMTTIHRVAGASARGLFCDCELVAITKGAPDRLIEWASHEHVPDGPRLLTDDRRRAWQAKVDEMAAQGLRVLGVAYRPLESVPAEVKPEIERGLCLVGLVGIMDPARPEARAAVQTAREAGIRSVMITGDHLLTGEAIARDLGIIKAEQHGITGVQIDQMSDDELRQALETTSAFARVSPEHKLRLVRLLQEKGHVVAMTGDGVNDAPALKQADIGVAMGITGTEVSKGAADMVLTDDNFASIVAAVEEGRTIYDNIRKFIRYLLSSNVGEILVMFLALLVGWPIPLLAIQILWVNLVTDGLPAIALGFEPGEPGVMKRKPRPPQESIFAGGLGARVIWMAIVLAAVTLAGYWWGFSSLNLDINDATLNLESFSAAELTALVGPDDVPANWDSLSLAERSVLLGENEASSQLTLEETAANPLLNHVERYARTIAFTVLALGQIFHVSAIHAGVERSFFREWFKKNRFLLWAVVGTFALQLAVVYVPFLQAAFETVTLNLRDLLIALALASVVLWVVELEKLMRKQRRAPEKA